MEEYLTVAPETARVSEVIERSEFISFAKGISDKEEALEFVSGLKKKYYDATHVCYAFVTDETKRYSDDGEPQGTAGMPILDVIEKKNLKNVCVAVVRYFGGIKLGAGGLTRAYSGGAAAVLSVAKAMKYTVCRRYSAVVPYSFLKTAKKLTEDVGRIDDTAFGEAVVLTVTITDGNVDYEGRFVNASSGKIIPEYLGEVFVPVEI